MLRRIFGIFSFICLLPAAAFAQGNSAVVGFGGFSLNGFDSTSTSVGGAVSVNLTPGIQAVGEIGHLGNVLPTLSDTVFSLARTGISASAVYGEGGVRLIAPRAAIAPYAEATAGFARLDVNSALLGGLGNIATDLALGVAGRTMPIASVGGGVLARGGPVVFDVGYRYKQLFADDVLEAVLGLGQPLHAHQLRAGIGVRF
jgi:hypothetical protein